MYNCFKELSTDIVFNVLYIYIFFILFYIMYNIHVVKRFRAHCGFYAIENKLLLLLLLLCGLLQSLKLGTHHATFVGPTIVVCRDDDDDC